MLVRPYLLSGLARGVPSLFADIKSLYSNVKKRDAVQEIVEGVLADLEKVKEQKGIEILMSLVLSLN